MPDSINLRLLETFCCVYEQGSFSRAAERLQLTQPTISGHMRTLEEFFGTPLFDRLGRSIEPTPAGRFLYEHGEKILEMKEQALGAMDRFLNRVEGKLRLGASTVPGEFVLPAAIGQFHGLYPKIHVQLIVRGTTEITRLVAAGEVEMGFVGSAWEDSALQFAPWGADALILAAPPAALWPHKKERITLKELRALPLLVREEGSGTRMIFERKLLELKSRLEDFAVVAELGSATAIIEAVKAGVGASFLSAISVKQPLARGDVRQIDVEQFHDARRIFYTVSAKQRSSSPLRHLFTDFLAQQKTGRRSSGVLASFLLPPSRR